MKGFTNENIKFDVLRQRAYNMRWAEQDADVIPLTAADHDFPCAPEVVQALQDYIKEGYFTYTPHRGFPSFKKAIAKAMKERKNEDVNPDFVLPIDSAARGMKVIADAVLQPGDEVIVFDPVDFLFRTSMESAGAKVILFPTNLQSDCVSLEGLEDYITPKTKMLGFCNPHNPTGHVWSKEEMIAVVELCDKYGMLICSDEIWADFQTGGHKHVPLHTCCPRAKEIVFSMYAPSKTFNLAGLQGSYSVCWNPAMKARVAKAAVASHYNAANVLSVHAAIGAYNGDEGAQYVDAMNAYIRESQIWLKKELETNIPGLRIHLPDATYLLWVNFEDYCKQKGCEFQEVLDKVTAKGVIPNDGRTFHGATHLRLNLACPRSQVEECAKRMIEALA